MSTETSYFNIKAVAKELAKGLKTEKDLAALSQELMKLTVETALNAELDEHLGYEKHNKEGNGSGNSRNGFTTKTLKSHSGEFEISTPRDRNGDFEPILLAKRQTRLTQFDNQVLSLYARGMTTRDITSAFEEMYGAHVSPKTISKITDAVYDEVIAWQNRPLDAVYPIIYLDCLVVKIRQDNRVMNKAIYLALGVNTSGEKELLGMWVSENEGAKFGLSVLTELSNRGVKDIFIACVDGLTGFPDAIETVFPKTKVQLCIVHMVRNSLKYVSYKDYKAVTTDLKAIYHSVTVEQAEKALSVFETTWNSQYPAISKSWRRRWEHVTPLFAYPTEIRKIIYTTNAIESVNSVIRKAVKQRKLFPTDKSAFKVVYLAIMQASKKWTMPLRDWKAAMNRFSIEYEERFE